MRIVLLVLLCGAAAYAQSRTYPIMTTIAGGNPSYFDNNGSTIENAAALQGIAVDAAGNIYFGEFFEGNVRRVNAGINPGFRGINTVAGLGYPDFFQTGDNFNGDGLQATLAPVAQPQRFAFDLSGSFYFLDVGNGTVNRINSDGTLTIVAGTGNGADAPAGDGGPAKQAALVAPRALAIDKSNNTIYISDSNGLTIRKIANGIITTIAGKGTPGFSGDNGPAANATFSRVSGLAVDTNGTVYLAADNRVRTIGADGIIRTVAGTGANGATGDGGLATAAAIGGARTLAFDGAGNLYVCQLGAVRIRKIDRNGVITTVAGGGTQPPPAAALSAQLAAPDDIALDSQGRLYITDGTLNEVLVVDTDGFMSVLVSTTQPSYANAKSARFLSISSIAVDPLGRVYVADQDDGRFWVVNPDGSLQMLLNAGRGNPAKVGADASGNVYVGFGVMQQSGLALQISKVAAGGSFVSVATLPTQGSLSRGGMAFDSSGNLYVSAGSQVFRVTPGGTVTVVVGIGTPGSSGDGGPATKAQLNSPAGVTMKSDGTLYIADAGAGVVRFVTPDGIIHTVTGSAAGLTHQNSDIPTDVAVDSQGNLYIGDGFNDHVYIVTPAGAFLLYAGFNGPYGGDGLPANLAALADVDGLAIDSAGNLYVGDNWSVRKISLGALNQ